MAREANGGLPKTTPFDERDSYRTLALEVDGRVFWVSREVLATYSPVFETMLYGEFAEAKKDKIKLPEKKAEDVEELLLCLIPTPTRKSIDYSNVELMLKFADEYQIGDLRERASTALTLMAHEWGSRDRRLLEILRIGSEHRMKEALRVITKRCGMEFAAFELEHRFSRLRGEVVAALKQYRTGTLTGWSKCRYEFSGCQQSCQYCAPQRWWLANKWYYRCTRCGAKRCNECLGNEDVARAKCRGTDGVEDVVRDLLNRM